MTKLSLIYLEWLDAGKLNDDDWLTWGEIQQTPEDIHLNISVGWIVKEDEQAITISPQIAVSSVARAIATEDEYDSVMRIPKSLIRKRKPIKL